MKQPHIARAKNGGRDDYCTPRKLFKQVSDAFHFDIDAAASDENHLCLGYYTKDRSLLDSAPPWGAAIWCNPPFSTKENFLEHLIAARNRNRAIVFILPNNARETKWWGEFVRGQADEVINLIPRVNYLLDGVEVRGVGYSSCLVVYRPRIVGACYGEPRECYWLWARHENNNSSDI